MRHDTGGGGRSKASMDMSIVLRAQITIDLDAEDFVGAADHQRRIEDLMQSVKRVYREAQLEFRERRPRPARVLPPPRPLKHYTAAAADYDE